MISRIIYIVPCKSTSDSISNNEAHSY